MTASLSQYGLGQLISFQQAQQFPAWEAFKNAISSFSDFLWSGPLTILLLGTGFFLTLVTAGICLRRIPSAFKMMFAKPTNNEGVTTKYAESLLAVQYRTKDKSGAYVGGPMYYIRDGMGPKWKWLAALFACGALFAAFVTGNMIQANAVSGAVKSATANMPLFGGAGMANALTGFLLAAATFIVIIGGIKGIGNRTNFWLCTYRKSRNGRVCRSYGHCCHSGRCCTRAFF